MGILIDFIVILCHILTFTIIIRAILSWFSPSPDNPLVRLLNEITEPILAPLRRIVPQIGVFDITPIIAIILLQIVSGVVLWAAS
jgi:YggT family protein